MNRIIPAIVLMFTLLLLFFSCAEHISEPGEENPPDTSSFFDPYKLTAEIANGGITLNWNAITFITVDGYDLFRKVDHDSSFALLRELGPVTSYIDSAVQNGHHYEYYVTARTTDDSTTPSNVVTISINTEPMLVIEGDSVATTPIRDVSLTILAFGADKMLLSNDDEFTDVEWESYSSLVNWQLTEGIGTKTVYLRIYYSAGDTSDVISDSIEPAVLSPVLDILPLESDYVNSRYVMISTQGSGASQIKISNVNVPTGLEWIQCQDSLEWSLDSGPDGERNVYAWFKNDFYTTAIMANDRVFLDTHVEVAGIDWENQDGNKDFIVGDILTFTLSMHDDEFGSETGGYATVNVPGWDPVELIDQNDGTYAGSITLESSLSNAVDDTIIVTFVDRAGNRIDDPVTSELFTFEGTWVRNFGGEHDDCGYSIVPTSDNCYVIAGYTRSFSGGMYEVWLIKADAWGNKVWDRIYSFDASTRGIQACVTSDGGFAIVGYIWDDDTKYDVCLIKTDELGNEQWMKTYGGNEWDLGYGIVETSDGGFAISGTTESYGDRRQVLLIKTDASGNQLWFKTFGGPDNDSASKIIEAENGDLVLGARIYTSPASSEVSIIRTNSVGNTLWILPVPDCYGEINSIKRTSDGGLIAVSSYRPSEYHPSHSTVFKVDGSGNVLWRNNYHEERNDIAEDVIESSDGQYVVVGWSQDDYWTTIKPPPSLRVLKLDESGNVMWNQTFRTFDRYYKGYSILETNAGGFMITGITGLRDINYWDVLLLKLFPPEDSD